LFFAAFYVAIYFSLTYLKKDFAPGAIPGLMHLLPQLHLPVCG
jgi:hypothetical protein